MPSFVESSLVSTVFTGLFLLQLVNLVTPIVRHSWIRIVGGSVAMGIALVFVLCILYTSLADGVRFLNGEQTESSTSASSFGMISAEVSSFHVTGAAIYSAALAWLMLILVVSVGDRLMRCVTQLSQLWDRLDCVSTHSLLDAKRE